LRFDDSSSDDKATFETINSIAFESPVIDAKRITAEMELDALTQRILNRVRQGDWRNCSQAEAQFKKVSNKLTLENGLLYMQRRVFIPPRLRKAAFDAIHDTHTGMHAAHSLMSTSCWWPGMQQDVAQFANGAAERAVQTVKSALRAWSEKITHMEFSRFLQKVLLHHRNSASSRGCCPAEILFGRRLRVPVVTNFEQGDSVIYAPSSSSVGNPAKFVMTAGQNTAWILADDGLRLASTNQLAPMATRPSEFEMEDEDETNSVPETGNEPVAGIQTPVPEEAVQLRRSLRNRSAPERFVCWYGQRLFVCQSGAPSKCNRRLRLQVITMAMGSTFSRIPKLSKDSDFKVYVDSLEQYFVCAKITEKTIKLVPWLWYTEVVEAVNASAADTEAPVATDTNIVHVVLGSTVRLAGEGGSGRVGPEAPGPRRRGPHASCAAAEQAAKAWTMRKPCSGSTVNTAFSVISMSTQALPVRGRLHLSRIFALPSCGTRDRLARSPVFDTCIAPSTVRSMWPPRIMAKLDAESKSGSTCSAVGYGPRPRKPFSDCRCTFMPAGMKLAASIGIPIPRFTYMPSLNSSARRRMMRSRDDSPTSGRIFYSEALGIYNGGASQQPFDVNAGDVHLLRWDLACLNDLLNLCDGCPLCRAPGLHQREVACDGPLQHVVQAIELAVLALVAGDQHGLAGLAVLDGRAALVDQRAVAGGRVECGDAGASRPDPLGQGALRGHHPADLSGPQQPAQPEVVNAGIVADHRQVLGAVPVQAVDEILRDAAESEAANKDARAVRDVLDGLQRDGIHVMRQRFDRQRQELQAELDELKQRLGASTQKLQSQLQAVVDEVNEIYAELALLNNYKDKIYPERLVLIHQLKQQLASAQLDNEIFEQLSQRNVLLNQGVLRLRSFGVTICTYDSYPRIYQTILSAQLECPESAPTELAKFFSFLSEEEEQLLEVIQAEQRKLMGQDSQSLEAMRAGVAKQEKDIEFHRDLNCRLRAEIRSLEAANDALRRDPEAARAQQHVPAHFQEAGEV
uniref:Integrase_H2C2 domain-containing protein n=1 Tax=Macrostomum lignano TaxID=282301 RepID=A0A1I8FRW6_9PLAT